MRRSSCSTPAFESPMTSRGPVTGYAATGSPQAMASSNTRPKVSVLLGNTNTSAAAYTLASSSRSSKPEVVHLREALADALERRPRAHHPLRSRQVELEERLDVLLHRHAPDVQENRRRAVEPLARLRMEDVRRPRRATRACTFLKPLATQVVDHHLRRRHHALRWPVKVPQPRIAPATAAAAGARARIRESACDRRW